MHEGCTCESEAEVDVTAGIVKELCVTAWNCLTARGDLPGADSGDRSRKPKT